MNKNLKSKYADEARQIISDFERGASPSYHLFSRMEMISVRDSKTVEQLIAGLGSSEYLAVLACAEALARTTVEHERVVHALTNSLKSTEPETEIAEGLAEALGELSEHAVSAMPLIINKINSIKKFDTWENRYLAEALISIGPYCKNNKELFALLKKLIKQTPEGHYQYDSFVPAAKSILDGAASPFKKNKASYGNNTGKVGQLLHLRALHQRLLVCRWKEHPANPGYDTRSDKTMNKDNSIIQRMKEIEGQMDELEGELGKSKIEIDFFPEGNVWKIFDEMSDSGASAEFAIKIAERDEIDPETSDPAGFTLLHWAVGRYERNKIIPKMIDMGFNVNAKDIGGFTPLHLAAQGDFGKVAEILVKNGADVHALDQEGKTPLDIAIENKSTSVVKQLMKT